MPTIVISAVNIVDGGMLKILQDCLATVRVQLPDWRVIALVNNDGVSDVPGIEKIVMPDPKRSWFRRVYAEYFTFRKLSKGLDVDIWWSLHDISPRVKAKSQFVYCHNPAAMYEHLWWEFYIEPKLIPFRALYSIFYRINIKSNLAVVVQQQWMRREFKRRYGVSRVIVAHPVDGQVSNVRRGDHLLATFVYPALSRAFKNFELIGRAARILEQHPDWHGRILWTISPDENRLTRKLFREFGSLKSIEFIGRQDRDEMIQLYDEMDCLLFPSRLETWGLPISETKELGKPMIVADLPYAHETVGSYDQVRFTDPADPAQLAALMLEAHRLGWRSEPVQAAPVEAPFADSWPRLVNAIFDMHHSRSEGVPCGGN